VPDKRTSPDAEAPGHARRGLRLEVITAILLGLGSVATAFSAFEAAIYDDKAGGHTAQAERLTIESAAEFQASQITYGRDVQSFSQALIVDPTFAADGGAGLSSEQRDAREAEAARLVYVLGSPAFQTAYWGWVDRQATEGGDISPLSDAAYLESVGASSAALADQAVAARKNASVQSGMADTVSQASLIYAIALFLLGIAGVNRHWGTQLALVSLGGVVLAAGAALAATVPLVFP
jgi:hypothetical protein